MKPNSATFTTSPGYMPVPYQYASHSLIATPVSGNYTVYYTTEFPTNYNFAALTSWVPVSNMQNVTENKARILGPITALKVEFTGPSIKLSEVPSVYAAVDNNLTLDNIPSGSILINDDFQLGAATGLTFENDTLSVENLVVDGVPFNPDDFATDSDLALKVNKAGDTMTGPLAMGANKVTSSATPTTGNDLTNKTYVDAAVSSAPKFYNSVDAMKSASLVAGDAVETRSYYSILLTNGSEKGGAAYQIMSLASWQSATGLTTPDGHGDHVLNNGLVAKIIINGKINGRCFGMKGDGVANDSPALQAAVNYGSYGFDLGYGKTVFIPKAEKNGNNSYLLNSIIEVPPAVIIEGEGLFNANNVSGSHFRLNHAGVGFRLIRRTAGASLFHHGGLRCISISGTGVTSTLTQRLVELGDPAQVNTTNGAWNGFIENCLFNDTRGYGVYSAHSQEFRIQGCMFKECNRSVNYSTVPASSRITECSFINESATPCDYAVNYEPGALGGNGAGVLFENNYIIGFIQQMYVAGTRGLIVRGNGFEACINSCIKLSNTTYSGTNLGTSEPALPSANIYDNYFITINTSNGANHGIVLENARFCNIENNFVDAVFTNTQAIIHLTETSAGLCSGNNIELPIYQGANSGVVPLYDTNNALWANQTFSNQFFTKTRNTTGGPVLGTTGYGAQAIINSRLYTYLPDQNWQRVSTVGEKTLAANTTSTSVMGLTSIINQNTNVQTLSTFTDGVPGQVVVIRPIAANTTVSVTGSAIVVPIYKCLTVCYSQSLGEWFEVSRNF